MRRKVKVELRPCSSGLPKGPMQPDTPLARIWLATPLYREKPEGARPPGPPKKERGRSSR